MSVVFATSSPERVRGLVLYGTAASFMARPGHPSGLEPERVPEVLGMVRERWGTGDVFGLFMQNAPDPAAAQRWLARFERNACSPAVATDVMRRNLEIDVRPLLPALAVPTLVVHHEGDPIVPLASARAMAEQIPGARFRQVPGAVHATWSPDDLLEVRREVHAFLEEGGAPAGAADRALATVLFTDISSSTQLAASVGDRAWHELLDQHDRISARHVEQLGGRLVTTTGDGVLATFDSPARAIRCATALGEALRPVGLRIRSGLHTGEVELRGADVSGLAVVIARRVCDLAARDQVLVSRTVKDLVAGSAIGFVEHGRHTLKGVPDEWELYAASA